MLPAFKPLPKVTIARYFSPVRGAHRILCGCVAEIAIGLVRCLCTHAQLRVALVIIRRKLAGGRSGVPTARSPQRVSVTGAGEDVSDGEGVGVMFLLMRYQIVIATRREINFARQFSSVSLVHRTETNIARQFFEVCPFIIAVQQNFPRGIKIIRCQVGVLEEKRICPSSPPSSPTPALARSNASGPSRHSQWPRVGSTVVVL